MRTTPVWLLVLALLSGILGQFLLDAYQSALGLALAQLFVLAITAWQLRGALTRTLVAALAVMAVAALLQVGRADEALRAFAAVLFAGAGGVALWSAAGATVRGARLVEAVRAGLHAFLTFLAGPLRLLLAARADGSDVPRTAVITGVGTIVALPFLAIVLALLGAADFTFGAGISALLELISTGMLERAVQAAILAWIVAGWLQGIVRPTALWTPPALPRIPFAATAPALIGSGVILAAYLGLQARVLFGGEQYVRETLGLSFAEHARSGFFQLVVVAGLVVGLLLAVDAVLDAEDSKARANFRATGQLLVGLVVVLAISAVQRLALYVEAFGWSLDRFYAASVLTGLIGVLLWFGATVLRDQVARFAPGVCVWAVLWVLGLHLVNPAGFVARANLERAREGKTFDVAYHQSLGADAVPALVRGRGALAVGDCTTLMQGLQARRATREAQPQRDWRSWNVGDSIANGALSSLTCEESAQAVP